MILALDTALGACSAALGDDRDVIAARYREGATIQAEALMPMIAEVLEEARCTPGELSRIGVTIGPGSFAGTRIGLAAARALGRVLGCPVIGLTTFRALAAAIAPGTPLAVAFDARRAQIYLQVFAADGTPVTGEDALGLDAAARRLAALELGAVALAGSGAALLAAALGASARVLETPVWPDAAAFLPAVRAAALPAPGEMPRPLYLRPPDVTLPSGSPP